MAVVDNATPSPMANTSAQQGFGDSHCRDSIGAEPPNPKDIDYCKERFQHHLQHHRDRQQQDRSIQAARGVVLVRSAQGFAHGGPEPALRLGLDREIHESVQ
jgi:hypothetical protein